MTTKKVIIIFVVGLVESIFYTLYLLTVGRYMLLESSILMFIYMVVYLYLIDRIAKDKVDSIALIISYSLSCGIGNAIAMGLHLVK